MGNCQILGGHKCARSYHVECEMCPISANRWVVFGIWIVLMIWEWLPRSSNFLNGVHFLEVIGVYKSGMFFWGVFTIFIRKND